jgi:hypothetical protein
MCPTIKIETGNPNQDKVPASFTRFVLPFTYKVKDSESSSNKLKWHKKQIDSLSEIEWRKQYFTDEVADTLFDKSGWYCLKDENDDYHRTLKIKRDNRTLEIEIKSPQLILFQEKSEVEYLNNGLLVIEVYFPNRQEISLDDLLFVNENLRYKEQIFEGHLKKIDDLFESTEAVKKLAASDENEKIKHYFDFWHYLLQQPIEGEGFLVNIEDSIQFNRPKEPRREWDIYSDARTFVWTCAVEKDGANILENKFGGNLPTNLTSNFPRWEAQNYGHWIKLLNVDSPAKTEEETHKSIRNFEREWAKERTYHRWEEKLIYPNNYYGFSYHSGAALISDCPDPPLWKHWGTMYFDMILLLFYIRVTLFRFSNELSNISSESLEVKNRTAQIGKWSQEFSKLRWEFTLFTNLFQHPLISNQQQGLEMYALARKHLDLDQLFKEIQEEIHNGQEFIQQVVSQEQSESSLNLTRVATLGLAFSIALAFIATDLAKDVSKSLVGENGYLINTPFYRENGFDARWSILLFVTIISFFGLRLLSCIWKNGIKKTWECLKETFRRNK